MLVSIALRETFVPIGSECAGHFKSPGSIYGTCVESQSFHGHRGLYYCDF